MAPSPVVRRTSPRLRKKRKSNPTNTLNPLDPQSLNPLCESFSEMSYTPSERVPYTPAPSERDPLLPNDKPAPEIQGSRPQSLYLYEDDEALIEAQLREGEEAPAKRLINNVMALALGVCFVFTLYFILFPIETPRPAPKTLEERVNKILTDTPLIDGHNNLAILIRFLYNNHIYDGEFKKLFEEGGMPMHVDIPRLREGKNGGAFWSVFVPCPANGTDFSDENYADSISFTLAQLDLLHRLHALYPSLFSPPPNSTSAPHFHKNNQLISPLAIEGLHQIGNRPSNLRLYHALGVRYATLTHNCHNIYADAALLETPQGGIKVAEPFWDGVSPAGQQVIQEMNRLGLIVDLSHTSKDTQLDVLGTNENWNGSSAPVIFSHASAWSICPHPRNVQDDVLQLVKKRRGLVMVNFSPDFVACHVNSSNPEGLPVFEEGNNTLDHVVDHILHIAHLIGWEYVGLGSDFDGISSTPRGLDDVSKFPDLVKALLKRGASDRDAGLVVGGNLLRVWGEVDAVAERLQEEGIKPLEDPLESLGAW